METKVPFTWTHGPSGFVPAEALRTFKSKDSAVSRLVRLTSDREAPRTEEEQAEMTRLARSVHSANRRIRAKGWFFTRA